MAERSGGLHGGAGGFLILDKPRGFTSHDVVARVRRLTGERRVGHAGTLDPLATGVLVVCLGKATRLAEYVSEGDKIYRAEVRLGVVTDTWDAEGAILSEADPSPITRQAVEEVLARFTGEIWQTPPAFSALKQQGRPLYRLARRGVTVEPPPRRVTIYRISLDLWAPPRMTLTVYCSKGTYIRSLAHDIGQALGVGAHLAGLVRLAVGPFRLEEAISLEALARSAQEGDWPVHLVPMARALEHLGAVVVEGPILEDILHGRQVPLEHPQKEGLCAAYDVHGELLAILAYDAQSGLWQPRKVLMDEPKRQRDADAI